MPVFDSRPQGILSSIASYMASRLEHDPHQGIGILVNLNDRARAAGSADRDIHDLIRMRLLKAGIHVSEEEGTGGCALGVAIEPEGDGLCCFDLEFFRVQGLRGRESTRPARGGAWRLTVMVHAETAEAVQANLSLMLTEFLRQYMEAN